MTEVHPRLEIVQKAETAIKTSILSYAMNYNLTSIELLQILNAIVANELKYMLRIERHPKNPGKKADEL